MPGTAKNDLIQSNLENEKNVEISKREIMEERAKHVTEDTERRVQLIEHRTLKNKEKMNDGIIQLAENLIDDIGKCRVQLRSA